MAFNLFTRRIFPQNLLSRTYLFRSRYQSSFQKRKGLTTEAKSTLYYTASVAVVFVGFSFAAVPLYQLFCSATGIDGTPKTGAGTKYDLEKIVPAKNAKAIKITFDSSVSEQMPWKFVPEVRQISVIPGETALAFFKAKNNSDGPIVGISTYSVVPYKAAQYFNKIQCFCFEEQRLEQDEEVDMPVFFFIDPEFSTDPWMKDVKEITLHYTFFRSKHQ
jgi:cytochrome c oxidase assembly protein subunit 11